jgi:outer membrane protein OmpA-like peptidoglycan-associated protein
LGESTVPLELRIHTSIDLGRRAAQLLSEERATTIRRFLEEHGVPAHTYRLIGFGNNLTGSGGERVEVLKK